jgi:hypothetical protein
MCRLCTEYHLSGRWQSLELNEIWEHYREIYADYGPDQLYGSSERVAARFVHYGNTHHMLKPDTLDWDYEQWEWFVVDHRIAPILGAQPYSKWYRDNMAR